MIDEKGVHKRWDFHQLVSKGARFQNCQPLYYSYKTHKTCAKRNKISFLYVSPLKLNNYGLCATNKRVTTISLSLTEHSHFDNSFPL